jgi:hypothetical protein
MSCIYCVSAFAILLLWSQCDLFILSHQRPFVSYIDDNSITRFKNVISVGSTIENLTGRTLICLQAKGLKREISDEKGKETTANNRTI